MASVSAENNLGADLSPNGNALSRYVVPCHNTASIGGIVFRFKKRHIPFHVLPDSVSPLTFKCFSVSNILYDNT